MYIMRRTQLYLDEDIWKLLHVLSQQSKASVSDLVRQAVEEKYVAKASNRQQVFEAVVGIWKNRRDVANSERYVRRLRRGRRLERLAR